MSVVHVAPHTCRHHKLCCNSSATHPRSKLFSELCSGCLAANCNAEAPSAALISRRPWTWHLGNCGDARAFLLAFWVWQVGFFSVCSWCLAVEARVGGLCVSRHFDVMSGHDGSYMKSRGKWGGEGGRVCVFSLACGMMNIV